LPNPNACRYAKAPASIAWSMSSATRSCARASRRRRCEAARRSGTRVGDRACPGMTATRGCDSSKRVRAGRKNGRRRAHAACLCTSSCLLPFIGAESAHGRRWLHCPDPDVARPAR
jgi:hypothetical protein